MASNFNVDNDGEPISAINVTPFVDVVLVLLVIFMVTAPILMKQTLNIQLPKTKTSDGKSNNETLAVAITKQGQILVNGQLSSDEDLKKTIHGFKKPVSELHSVISADREAKHGDVVRVIDILKTEGITRFAIQIETQK
jgi:biopolymer transport protein ExbD